MFSNPCEWELTCFRPESNRGPYRLLIFLCAALSTTELWWRMNHRKSFRTLFVKWMKDSCYTFQRVTSHVSTSHATRVNKTRHTLWKKCYYWLKLNTESQQRWLQINIYIYTYISTRVDIHMPVHLYQNHGHPSSESASRISPAIPVHIFKRAHIHKHTNVCLYIYIHTHICIYICVWLHINTSPFRSGIEGTGTRPDYLVNRADPKNEGLFEEKNCTEIEK